MTSWRHVIHLFLFVFLSEVDLSEEGCYDHLPMEKWTRHLADSVAIVRTINPKHTVECTLERECLQRGQGLACDLLYNCYDRDNEENTSKKCEGETSQNIHYYHLRCLVAKSVDSRPTSASHTGCEYDTVCKLYSETTSTDFDQTTTLPPPPPTPTTPSTTTLPETTTTTVLPPTVTAMPPTATTLSPTPTVTQSTVIGSSDKRSDNKYEADSFILKMLLILSAVFNVVLPLAVYIYMRRQRRQPTTQWTSTHISNGDLTGDLPLTELQTEIQLASNGVVETKHLIQSPDCHSVLAHSPDRL